MRSQLSEIVSGHNKQKQKQKLLFSKLVHGEIDRRCKETDGAQDSTISPSASAL